MEISTRLFGNIEVENEKVISFDNGLIGFETLKKYMLIHDTEKETAISWLQSIEDKDVAFPVVDPLFVLPGYNPIIEDELVENLGELNEEEILVLAIVTAANEKEKISANLKAPIIINASTLKAIQIIVENKEYNVKHLIYDMIKKSKGGE